jgi:hypothetical protein
MPRYCFQTWNSINYEIIIKKEAKLLIQHTESVRNFDIIMVPKTLTKTRVCTKSAP